MFPAPSLQFAQAHYPIVIASVGSVARRAIARGVRRARNIVTATIITPANTMARPAPRVTVTSFMAVVPWVIL